MEEGAQSSGKAITSLVLGVFSLVCSCVAGIPAIIFGFLALSDIKSNPSRLTGQGMAIAGIVLGFVGSTLVAVVVLMSALMLPAIQAARNAARNANSRNNMKQMGLALHTYAESKGAFPAQFTLDSAGQPGTSWRVQLLPYMEGMVTFQLYHFDEPWNSPGNTQAMAMMPPQFENPLDDAPGNADPQHVGYVAVAGPGFAFDGETPHKISDFKDGLSNTIMVVDVAQSGIALAEPRDLTWDEFLAKYQARKLSGDFEGFNALFADGSVHRIPYDLDLQTLRAYFTIDGGENVPPPMFNAPR